MLSRDGSFAFQMAQSGNFRRLLPILGYMYHPNMLQTLGSNDWRESLFSQNSKTLSSWREQDKRQKECFGLILRFWERDVLRQSQF